MRDTDQAVKSLWSYLETSPSERQSKGKATSETRDPSWQITFQSFSLIDVLKRNNGTSQVALRDNHGHCQGVCICAKEGRTDPLTLENSRVIILQLDATCTSCTFAWEEMQRDLCWKELLGLNTGPGSHGMSSLSLAIIRHKIPRATAARKLCRKQHHPQHLDKDKRVRMDPWQNAQPWCSQDTLWLFALHFLRI